MDQIPHTVHPETVDRIIAQLWPNPYDNGRRVYALIDSAHSPDIFPWLTTSGQPLRCLYREPISEKLQAAAPYIIELSAVRPFTRQLLEKSWGQSWGLFVAAPATIGIDLLSQHCRKLNLVKGPKGEKLYFRYYDPRVMGVYLPTCTPAELQTVFGPITELYLEREDDLQLQQMQRQQNSYQPPALIVKHHLV